MTSTTTEAVPSMRHNGQHGQLAVRLAPMPSQPSRSRSPSVSPAPSPVPDQKSAEFVPRRRPKKPAIPRHPIPTMQEAFAESLAEVSSGTLSMKPKIRVDTPQIRRDRLLDQDKTEGPPAAMWRMRPAQNCHELRKLLAQIAFGVYLLLKGMANSDAQVVAILQGHIDEVDDFLKTAMEDLNLATQDLNTRLDYLKLPLGNLPAFEEMLEDREFRLRIVEGNVRIEHILSRTTTALLQTIQDVSEGLRSTKEFTAYLANEEHGSWRHERPAEVAEIFEAMRGNAEGWLNAFADLEEKSNTLDLLISKLADMVTEMDRCAGEVSRRTRFSIKPYTLPELASRVSQESQESVDSSFLASYEATPPLSPGINVPQVPQVPQMPPRLSLRFSALGDILAPSFLDLGPGNNGPAAATAATAATAAAPGALLPTLQYTPPAETSNERLGSGKFVPSNPFEDPVETLSTNPHTHENIASDPFGHEADAVTIRSNTTAIKDADSSSPLLADNGLMPVPLRTTIDTDRSNEAASPVEYESEAEAEAGAVESPADSLSPQKEAADEEPLYILQPKIYTPQPSPLPSPRVPEASQHTPRLDSASQPRTQPEAASPRLYIPPVEERLSYRSAASPLSSGSYGGNNNMSAVPRPSPSAASPADSESSDRAAEMEFNKGIPKKKTSIRERVSLRTTPPDAILVPPPNAPQLQRAVFASPRTYQNYRTFTGPDSAYSSDIDRAASVQFTDVPPIRAGHAAHGSNGSNVSHGSHGSHDYSPPVFPNILPSPHSDQQYFRPVQASPHSPLQQRPHTAGQVPSRPYHLRNAPSSMGMSMLSSVTTMTQDSKGQPTLKKKRSAFGWLKKAFTLDEDERVTFDQRRQVQERNLYYDTKSPKFLDGKRVK
ncbi:hypothetical protein SCUCBS95973_006151 [Sporothrix curviconia]|uniref:Uncharacterized protein n=1 Tax=Sporothrix curviconia TaxID=1260050 RepID=A0ABP0C3R2_9PEZI